MASEVVDILERKALSSASHASTTSTASAASSFVPYLLLNGVEAEAESKRNYPDIKFHTRASWVDYYKSSSNMGGLKGPTYAENEFVVSALGFIEHLDGQRATADRILKAHQTIETFLKEMAGTQNVNINFTLDSHWATASLYCRKALKEKISPMFPELNYCASDWKMNEIAQFITDQWMEARLQASRTATLKRSNPENELTGSSSIDLQVTPGVK